MLGVIAAGLSAAFLFLYFIFWPVFDYFRDPKGLRKYPSLSPLAGITDFCFMIEARRGFRSKRLADLHKTMPIIRIGPNSLSFGDTRAIKVSQINDPRMTQTVLT